VGGEVATWTLGTLGPREARVIKVTGQVLAEGTITTCGWATYTPALCAPVRIIKPVNAILVEVVDDPDPIQVGESTTYTIRVTNQGGNTPLEDVAVVALFPGGLTPSAPSNDGTIDGQTVRWRPVTIAVRRAVAYTVKGMGTRNSRWSDLRVEVTTKGRERPIYELEATSVY
jgi:uncharacterized repeat protein (TIGR01451 family)